MEHLAWYELLLLFFAASFLGWVLETAAADIKQKKFVNRGLVTGPFCVMYGITTVLLTVGLGELRGIWLFLFSAIYATVVEWIGGHLIERLFHQRWWDYSGKKGNLDGYICLGASVFWGVLGFVMVTWGNDLLFRLKIGNRRVDADAETDTYGSDQILNREDQRERGHRIFIDLCHKITVDNVVQRIDHH